MLTTCALPPGRFSCQKLRCAAFVSQWRWSSVISRVLTRFTVSLFQKMFSLMPDSIPCHLLYIPMNRTRRGHRSTMFFFFFLCVCVPLGSLDSLTKCTGQWTMLGENLRTNWKYKSNVQSSKRGKTTKVQFNHIILCMLLSPLAFLPCMLCH